MGISWDELPHESEKELNREIFKFLDLKYLLLLLSQKKLTFLKDKNLFIKKENPNQAMTLKELIKRTREKIEELESENIYKLNDSVKNIESDYSLEYIKDLPTKVKLLIIFSDSRNKFIIDLKELDSNKIENKKVLEIINKDYSGNKYIDIIKEFQVNLANIDISN